MESNTFEIRKGLVVKWGEVEGNSVTADKFSCHVGLFIVAEDCPEIPVWRDVLIFANSTDYWLDVNFKRDEVVKNACFEHLAKFLGGVVAELANECSKKQTIISVN